MKKLAPYLLPILILFSYCGNAEQEVEEEKLAMIYVDLLLVNERYGNLTDSLNYHQQKVFTKHQVDETAYISTLESYRVDEEKWDSFFVKANAYLDSAHIVTTFE